MSDIAALAEQQKATDRTVAALDKSLAVHLAECAGNHKALEGEVRMLGLKLDGHIDKSEKGAKKVLSLLVLAVVLEIVLLVLGPQEAFKLFIGLVK